MNFYNIISLPRQAQKAVLWIVQHDNAGEKNSAEEIAGYASTALVAHVWNLSQKKLGQTIHDIRTGAYRRRQEAEAQRWRESVARTAEAVKTLTNGLR